MNKTGERLNHILDLIGFKVGRGRIPEFQEYLMNKVPGMETLKYSTVRSWFNNHAPPMKKVNIIVDVLHDDYDFSVNVYQIKVWWKLGGLSPFNDSDISESTSDKFQFLVTSMVTEESGKDFNLMSSDKLVDVKNKAIDFAEEFADPNKKAVPLDSLRTFIVGALSAFKQK
jgi:hypothetical protein